MTPEELHSAILAAHEATDGARLVELYAAAADLSEKQGDRDATCFFLTQAYVFALETGHERIEELHLRLKDYGRDE
ncbi:MAG: hypothetical protein AAGE80_11850 [Pseudomonadota bacterium]